MITIEPCCIHKQWKEIASILCQQPSVWVCGYGDMTFGDLLGAVVPRYAGVDLTVVCPTLPHASLSALKRWMEQSWAGVIGGSVHAIRRLTIITDARASKSDGLIDMWKKWKGDGRNVELASCAQNDTFVIFSDTQTHSRMLIYGALNMVASGEFTSMVSTSDEEVDVFISRAEDLLRRWKV